jgi:Protein of unknown function (DUF3341)
MSVYALYSQGEDAQRAVNNLRASGVADRDITVISNTPMEDFEFSHINGKNRLWYVASIGGLAGLLGSIALTGYTSNDWPMNVGNMATFAWWAYLVVIFETTMLGAILATVGTLIVTAGLLRRRPALYDPAVSDGKILVGLENPNQSRMKDLETALLSSPGVSLKTI